jgi:molybdopterin-containing oxidoreductase family membrane subunit
MFPRNTQSDIGTYFAQINVGLVTTNMSNIVIRGFYIGNFTFLVGVAAARPLCWLSPC